MYFPVAQQNEHKCWLEQTKKQCYWQAVSCAVMNTLPWLSPRQVNSFNLWIKQTKDNLQFYDTLSAVSNKVIGRSRNRAKGTNINATFLHWLLKKNKNNKRILSVQRGFYTPFFRRATRCRLPPPLPTQNGDGSSALFMSTVWNLATKSYPHRKICNKSSYYWGCTENKWNLLQKK